MINYKEYHQVFEETIAPIIEGMVKHAHESGIDDLKEMIIKWIEFYERRMK